jgi:hypothetical protein
MFQWDAVGSEIMGLQISDNVRVYLAGILTFSAHGTDRADGNAREHYYGPNYLVFHSRRKEEHFSLF